MKVFNIKALAHFGILMLFAHMARSSEVLFDISHSWAALIFALQVPLHVCLFNTKLKTTRIAGSITNRISNKGFMCKVSNTVTVSGNQNCDIKINGKSYTGKTLDVNGNSAYVDGVSVENLVKSITINGDVESVSTVSADVNIHKNARNVDTVSGNVTCGGDITGSVDTVSGNIRGLSLGKR